MRRMLCSLFLVFAVVGCGTDNIDGPSESVLLEDLQLRMPGHLDVIDLEVNARVNQGTAVDPTILARFAATVVVKEDTWTIKDRIGDTVLIQIQNPKGYEVKVYGRAESTMHVDQWKTRFNFENLDQLQLGATRAALPATAVLAGSAEARKLQAEEAARQAQREKHEEQQRLVRMELERERIREVEARHERLRVMFTKAVKYDGTVQRDGKQRAFSLSVKPDAGGSLTGTLRIPAISYETDIVGEYLKGTGEVFLDEKPGSSHAHIWKITLSEDGEAIVGTRSYRDRSGSSKVLIKL